MLISKGKVSQVIGPVVDVRFENGVELPTIFDALEVTKKMVRELCLKFNLTLGKIQLGLSQWIQQMVLPEGWKLFLQVQQ